MDADAVGRGRRRPRRHRARRRRHPCPRLQGRQGGQEEEVGSASARPLVSRNVHLQFHYVREYKLTVRNSTNLHLFQPWCWFFKLALRVILIKNICITYPDTATRHLRLHVCIETADAPTYNAIHTCGRDSF